MPAKKEENKLQYKNNFLSNVIIRIDFPKILELEGEKTPDEFQKKILKGYPNIDTQVGESLMVKLNPESEHEVKSEKKSIWLFSNKDRTQKITLSSTFLALEYTKYESFTAFRTEFEKIFDLLKELYPIGIVNRLGLRYINEIKIQEGNSLDYKGYINKNLTGIITNLINTDTDKPLRLMHLVSVKGEDGVLNFQFGIFNPEYPNPIARKEFILDYDYYSETDIEIDSIKSLAVKFNEFITQWFERSIDTKLRTLMNRDE